MANNGGFKPNFISLDWVEQSKEAQEIRDYLNFGGRLGTGQRCTDNSHCATSSCNVISGVCQCQECSNDSIDVCPGCEIGQYCFSLAEEDTNSCQNKDGTVQTNQPISSIDGGTDETTSAPTQSPTANRASDNFYCGEGYWEAIAGCNEGVKCPNGDECPDGQTCFAGIKCTQTPTLSPSTGTPTSSPTSSKPTASPVKVSDIFNLASSNRDFCGKSFVDARDNCLNALPCGGQDDASNKCAILLGPEYKCFPNIDCPTNQVPTHGVSNLGTSKAPSGVESSPTPSLPTDFASLAPTKVPFDFDNNFFCGSNYTDAENNCYTTSIPCPSGSPSVCGDGTCYSGITCNAPPTVTPTSNPTPASNFPDVYPPSESGTGPSPVIQPWYDRTATPFDQLLYENKSGRSTAASKCNSGVIIELALVAICVVGLLP